MRRYVLSVKRNEISSFGWCGDFVLRDSVEAVEKVFGCVAGGVTHTIPDSIVEMLGKTFRDERELDKGITPGHAFRCLKQMLDYQIQLDTAQPRIGLAKFSGFFDD